MAAKPRVLGSIVLFLGLVYVALCCWLLGGGGSSGGGGGSGSGSILSRASSPVLALLPRLLRGQLSSTTDEEAKAAIKAELGRGAWNMLHRMAASFAAAPTAAQQRDAVEFFRLLGELYPCEQCAAHFRGMLAATPVRAASNRELSVWLCERHNEVNTRLAKPQFDCALSNLKERYGDCGCTLVQQNETVGPEPPGRGG